jgi:putative DNA primase/helicase
LSGNFGLEPLIGKQLALISDARLSARADQATIAERLLSISGEDALSVHRKYKQAWHGKLSARFVILTNELPRIADPSGALAGRFVVLTLQRSFYGKEDPGLTQRLMGELPGILNWAIDGWQRLNQRGYFVQPKSSAEAIAELEELGSPIKAFVDQRCEVGPGHSVPVANLYACWKSWCEETGREHPGTQQSFSRDLRAAVPGLKTTQPRDMAGNRYREFEGIGLARDGTRA